jgi:multiple sugar transport system substrate-binding protein
MVKRWVPALAGLVAVVFAAAACGSGGSSGAGDKKVNLSYAVWNKDQVPAMNKIIAAFEQTHPNIDVTVQVTPFDQYWTKLQTAATGGSAPDVFWLNGPNFQLYASNHVLLPLGEKLKAADIDTSVYPKSLVDLYSYQNELYAVPKDFDTIGLWYNKALFDAAGVKYPDASWTWRDVQTAAKKLTNKAKGQYGVVAEINSQEGYYNTVAQAGGDIISADGKHSGYADPKTIQGVTFWTDFIKQGLSPTYPQMIDTTPVAWFQTGKVAMYYGGDWRAVTLSNDPNVKDKIDVAPLPKGPEGSQSVIHGLGNAVYAKTKHPQQALEFVEFLGGQQAAQIEAETGTVIPAYQGTQDAWVKAYPNYHVQVFLDEVAQAVPYPVSKNTAAWNQLETQYLSKAWSGQMDVGQACRELAQAMQADLDKE